MEDLKNVIKGVLNSYCQNLSYTSKKPCEGQLKLWSDLYTSNLVIEIDKQVVIQSMLYHHNLTQEVVERQLLLHAGSYLMLSGLAEKHKEVKNKFGNVDNIS